MRLSPKFILFVAMVCAFVAFMMIFRIFTELKKDPRGVEAVMAARDLEVGETLQKTDLMMEMVPKGTNLNTVFKQMSEVEGKVLRNPIRRGEVIQTFDLADEADSVAGLIPADYRAATLSLVLPMETLRLLKFGSRVDVLFTDTSTKDFETKTIMENILVMKASPAKPVKSKNGAEEYTPSVDVTVAVKPEGAEIFAYAVKKGKLDISVRSMTEKGGEDSYMNLRDVMGVKPAPVFMQTTAVDNEVEIYRGVKKEKVVL